MQRQRYKMKLFPRKLWNMEEQSPGDRGPIRRDLGVVGLKGEHGGVARTRLLRRSIVGSEEDGVIVATMRSGLFLFQKRNRVPPIVVVVRGGAAHCLAQPRRHSFLGAFKRLDTEYGKASARDSEE